MSVIRSPILPLIELGGTAARERQAKLRNLSGADQVRTWNRRELLHEIFESRVDANPTNIAVECGTRRISYLDLDRRANQLSHLLRSRGIGAGSTVAILLPRSELVYVAVLGILKSGAAYVPIDPDYPAERVCNILSDAKPAAIITSAELALKCPVIPPVSSPAESRGTEITPNTAREGTGGTTYANAIDPIVLRLDADSNLVDLQPIHRLTRQQTECHPEDLCYLIYTSGSTGRPKGVQIEHHSACNLVRAEMEIFGVQPADRVFQGFSIAFDASVEEVWLAFAAGATLVVGTADLMHAGPDLAGRMADLHITVLSCVPTLLSILEGEIPSLRLLILGGEACQADLVRRWSRPGRRMVNTYGPTEATVIATFGNLTPDDKVTLGRPVPNYRVYILDENLAPCDIDQPGEICIGGVGLARGYVNRDDLTAERFIPDPFVSAETANSKSQIPNVRSQISNLKSQFSNSARMYRTGDLGRWLADGRIEFLGRADSQVKLRGFRIELAEIESALLRHPEVRAASVSVRNDDGAAEYLAAYIVPRNGHFDETQLRSFVRQSLPTYMVPALVERVTALPTQPSGKVDRSRLPKPAPRKTNPTATHAATPTEARLLAIWQGIFPGTEVSTADDFFTDLGGHSLLAARFVSTLRNEAKFRDLSVLDVYHHPTISKLAAAIDLRSAENPKAVQRKMNPTAIHPLFYVAQFLTWLIPIGIISAEWLIPCFAWQAVAGSSMLAAFAVATGIVILMPGILLGVALAAKWILIGRIRAGTIPLWSFGYLRWWLFQQIMGLAPTHELVGTPLLNVYYRLLGARIGKNVFLGTDHLRAFDLISIGDNTHINNEANLQGCSAEAGQLIFGPIAIGNDCFIGTRCSLRPYTTMANGSAIEPLSLLPSQQAIPENRRYRGSPASDFGKTETRASEHRANTVVGQRWSTTLLHAVSFFLLPLVSTLPAIPGILIILNVHERLGGYWFLAASFPAAISFIVLSLLEIAALKWLLVGRVKAGTYRIDSFFYARKRFVDQLMDMSLKVFGPVYATLYLNPWFRLLGAKIGRRAEVSTSHNLTHDLFTAGDGSFFADSTSLGAPRFEAGHFTLAPVSVGERTFIGNSAVLNPGDTVGDNCLIGVLSQAPSSNTTPGTSWLGSPAIFLPQRMTTTHQFSETTTYNPTAARYAARLSIEFFRITLPTAFGIALTSLLLNRFAELEAIFSSVTAAAIFPILFICAGFMAAAIVIAAKWILIGTYKPGEYPLWSLFVWRTELLTALHEHLADPFLIRLVLGTPLAPWFFRMLGAKIGKRVYMDTTSLTEFDLISIGDDVCLNQDSVVQTHLFEDREMKTDRIAIGDGVSVGSRAIVLYDSAVHAGTTLDDLSLVMRGESLPADGTFRGVPARRA